MAVFGEIMTRSEIQGWIELLHSRITEEEPSSPLLRIEASSSSSIYKHKHGDKSDNVFSSRVLLEEQITLPPNASYKGSTIKAPRQENSKWINPPAATIENLPEEILTNIFIGLLAKQLAKMRSVSKSWNALLSQPSFIKSHLNRSFQNNSSHDQLVLLTFHNITRSFEIHTRPTARHLQLTDSIKLPVNLQFECANSVRVIGCVNGLICYSHGDLLFHIWNPSLSAVLTLPPYSMPSRCYDQLKIYFQFGFDPKTDDYKVVKVTRLVKPHFNNWWLDVEIYSMRKGTWEFITERFPSHISTINNVDNVCADGHDGHLHWLGYDDSYSQRLVAFDLGSETFREIPLPHSIKDPKIRNVLGVLAEKLCVISCDRWDNLIEVWVMDEYGVAESWVKRHVFAQSHLRPYGFTSHNGFLIRYDSYRVVLYDPVANKTEIFIQEHLADSYDKIVEYVDSLVWVTPAKREIVDDARKI